MTNLGLSIATVMLALAATPARAEPLQLVLVNRSPYPVQAFYASPVGEFDWRSDLFGSGYLPAGNEVAVTVEDSARRCLYDLRFVMADGSDFIDRNVNLCAIASYTLSKIR